MFRVLCAAGLASVAMVIAANESPGHTADVSVSSNGVLRFDATSEQTSRKTRNIVSKTVVRRHGVALTRNVVDGLKNVRTTMAGGSAALSEGVPVVYVWFGSDAFPEYFENTARVSAMKNSVVVLAEHGQNFKTFRSPNISYVDLEPYLAPSRYFFEDPKSGHYQPWGVKEPYEARNLWRAFAVNEWMRQAGRYSRIFFADCDVAALSDVTQTYHADYKGCDAAFSMENQTAESMYWVAWIGSGFMSQQVLSDFVQFAQQLYTPTYLQILQLKKAKKPYVCDMTAWYLYAAAAGAFPDASAKFALPEVSVRSAQLCNTLSPRNRGQFDHLHGYKKPDFKIQEDGYASFSSNGERMQLHSLHFQGKDKHKAGKVLEPLLQAHT